MDVYADTEINTGMSIVKDLGIRISIDIYTDRDMDRDKNIDIA